MHMSALVTAGAVQKYEGWQQTAQSLMPGLILEIYLVQMTFRKSGTQGRGEIMEQQNQKKRMEQKKSSHPNFGGAGECT